MNNPAFHFTQSRQAGKVKILCDLRLTSLALRETSKNIIITSLVCVGLILGPLLLAAQEKPIRHFIFFSREREGIHDSGFYSNPGIVGAQITYPWNQLEPRKDEYDLSAIEEDLVFLQSKGKKLFIQIQDVTFSATRYAIPQYLLTDTSYHGGANAQYEMVDNKPVNRGWVARRWDPKVAERFHKLLKRLADQFDGRIEGINLPETSVGFPDIPGLAPAGFSRESYLAGIKSYMLVLREYFKKSIPILYANFMPGDSRKDLEEIYGYARLIGLGMGGPDIKVYRPFQMKNSYPLIRELSGKVPTGVAVQDGNYSVINPKTGKPVTLPEILDFAKNYLKLDYVFWCTEEPYYRNEVLPMLRALGK